MATSIFLEPSATRLVTIIAHVDHGKTTLADNLVEYNGIISERLAGTVRYLDSDPEEQRRGITMRSSAIGLQHAHKPPKSEKAENHIIHLLDSPGHTDFSMEVSSALLACDSCLLVLDAVEGMAPRTHQVLREAYMHRLVPLLVVNKIDRLYTDLGLTPTESYVRLRGLLETVNAAASGMVTSAKNNQTREVDDSVYEAYWNFEPSTGNVIFCSALFGWGFTAQSLARSLFRQKVVPIKPMALKHAIFSDTKYVNNKLLKWKMGSDDEPLFAQYALQPLWSVYQSTAAVAATLQNRSQKLQLTADLAYSILDAIQTGCTDPKSKLPTSLEEMKQLQTSLAASTEEAFLRSLLRRYRPLAPAVLDTICEYCPSPKQAVSSIRSSVLSLRPHSDNNGSSTTSIPTDAWKRLQQGIQNCVPAATMPTVAHVCKFINTDRGHIRDPQLPDNGESTVLLGLTRVLSGSLRTDDAYYLYGPKYPSSETDTPQRRIVRLYLLMGSSFVAVPQVPAGHLCAVLNLEGIQFKTVTLSSVSTGMPLRGFSDTHLRPLVKVSIEPENAKDNDALQRGLLKLSLADAALEVTSTVRGERLLACLGELHLEQSILELENVYSGTEGIKVRVSDPIVDFGETTAWFDNETEENGFAAFFDDDKQAPLRQMTIPPYNEEEGVSQGRRGRARMLLAGRGAALSIRSVPLRDSIYNVLRQYKQGTHGEPDEETSSDLVKLARGLGLSQSDPADVLDALGDLVCYVDNDGNALMESPGVRTGRCIKGVTSPTGEVLGHKHIIVEQNSAEEESENDSAVDASRRAYDSLRNAMRSAGQSEPEPGDEQRLDIAAKALWDRDSMKSTIAGFQMAVRSGWICEEPIRNVLVLVEGIEVAVDERDGEFVAAKSFSGGMIVSAVRVGIRSSLLSRPARLVEGVLRLTLHSSLTGLGALYNVLSKRRGKVEEDTMVDGTDLLLISALLPQAESFGLATELLRQTSGEVTAPELIFSHWELLDEDPFWIPTSVEEREDYGELERTGDSSTGMDNTALKYIRQVRQRKGLVVDSSRTVIAAEKQRTLKR